MDDSLNLKSEADVNYYGKIRSLFWVAAIADIKYITRFYLHTRLKHKQRSFDFFKCFKE